METEARQVGSGLLKRHAHHVSLAQRVADGVLIALTNWAAALVYGQAWTHEYALATAVAVVFFYFVGGATGLYFSWRGAPLRAELRKTLVAWGATVTALLLLAFAFKSSAVYSRVVILAWFTVTPACLGLWRVAVRSVLKALRARGHNTRTVAIAGSTRVAVRVAQMLAKNRSLGFQLKAVYDDRTGKRRKVPETLAPHGGKLKDLIEHARTGAIDVVYLALPMRAEQRITETVRGLADTTATVYMVPDFHAYDLLHARWGNLGEIPVVSIFDTPLDGLGGWAKRLEDIVLASLILALVAVPMLVIAILIKLDSKGPVLFRQPRYGLNGKPINVWKFRSMRVMQTGSDVAQAKANDPRVTRIGAILRRTSLDELPQFFNVLLGDMSVVGPRPHAVVHNELYRAKIHGYMLRHKVKPGITGWAQVNGWRGETDSDEKMERRIEHDLDYINNWGLFWDLKIVWLTVFKCSARQNAY